MSDTNKMRRDFESWWEANMNTEEMDLHRHIYPGGTDAWSYADHETHRSWMTWQAATERATASQWQPIATAPKDIERILVFGVYPELPQEPPSVYTASYGFTTPYFDLDPSPHEEEYNTVQLTGCTHWMPLPPPPAIRQGGAT